MEKRAVPENVARLVNTVRTTNAAVAPSALRQAVAEHAAGLTMNRPDPPPLPEDLAPYVRKVTLHADKVLDRDVDALRAAGYSVDEIFEITVSAAVGAAFARMEAGLSALEERR
jgi:hypothetical protein